MESPVKDAVDLQSIVNQYLQSKDRLNTRWHSLCCDCPCYEKWKTGRLTQSAKFDLAFSTLAANAYQKFFELTQDDLPNSIYSKIPMLAGMAQKLNTHLPSNDLLPVPAQHSIFMTGLHSIANWTPSQAKPMTNQHGNPERRFLIEQILIGYFGIYKDDPPAALILHLVKLQWPDYSERSLRRVIDKMTDYAKNQAERQRQQENKSIATTHRAIAKASVKTPPAATDSLTPIDPDLKAIQEAEKALQQMSDGDLKKKLLSQLKAAKDDYL